MANYDPAEQACSPNYSEYRDYKKSMTPNIVGPGGRTTNIENNEKGILDSQVLDVVATCQYADLGSSHDAERQGIYRTNSVGDRD